jgi:hypothetical protein
LFLNCSIIFALSLGYDPVHRNVVTRRLKRLNHQKHNKLIEDLKKIETIAITMDFWSDRTNRSFLVITGHYYTNDHQQKSKILTFCSFDQRHTADQIAKIVKKKLQELNILHKVNRIVTDGARNLSSAIVSINLNADHIWCIAHRLHLVVTNALALWPKKRKDSDDVLNEGEKINLYIFKHSIIFIRIDEQLNDYHHLLYYIFFRVE